MEENNPTHDLAVANRFAMFRKEYIHKNQLGAAKVLGIPQSTIWRIEKGLSPVNFEMLSRLVKEYGANSEWVLYGTGSKIDKNPSKKDLITDLNKLNEELSILKKAIRIVELNHNHILKVLERQDKIIERLEKKLEGK